MISICQSKEVNTRPLTSWYRAIDMYLNNTLRRLSLWRLKIIFIFSARYRASLLWNLEMKCGCRNCVARAFDGWVFKLAFVEFSLKESLAVGTTYAVLIRMNRGRYLQLKKRPSKMYSLQQEETTNWAAASHSWARPAICNQTNVLFNGSTK